MNSVCGQCYCGACRYTVDPGPIQVIHCHCSMCRRQHGAAFSTWVSVGAQRFTLDAQEGAVRSFAVSERTTKFFCAACGTTLYHVTRGYDNVIGLLAGTLRTPVELRPTGHYFYSDRADWTAPPSDGLPLCGGPSGFEQLVR
ncbi:GFA family protein [Aquabacterium sp. A7-Y]|uniref:GFA family protein n=1 Tax=Aquabacterium sp. A7-Y TaxID=1349605 RepID=UPI00223DAA61|nr:GFA family protein [Aquabacterium sp. A7-Y]MCW7537956.1 GFA family protein [Aquabacterium sp. A7-Y]